MFKNYLVVALRSLKRNKAYSLINILGLTLGITACLLIGVYIWQETHFDRFHKNADRIMRVTMEYGNNGTINKVAVTGTKVGPEFARQFPAIESFTRTIIGNRVIANGDSKFTEKSVLFADPSFFEIFSFPLIKGNPVNCLSREEQIVITETMARKYFGNADPIGKTLRIADKQDYIVSAIAKEAPANSQIHFDFVIPFGNLRAAKQEEQWFTANYVTYLLLQNANQQVSVQNQIAAFMKQVSRKELFTDGSGYLTHNLEPLTKVHLYSSLNGLEPNGNITYIYVLAAIALLILFIAGVNYSNLATAISTTRGTEVGIRKVLGANQKQLWTRFLGESFILTIISLVLSLILTVSILPYFNSIAGTTIPYSILISPQSLAFMLFLLILISLFAGAYPAFILSANKAGDVLKSGLRVSASGGILRKGMIVFQFVIAVFLIIATIIVSSQLNYIRTKDLGYDKQSILILPADFKTSTGYDELKNILEQQPGIRSVSGAYESPSFVQWADGINAETIHGPKSVSVNAIPAQLDFIKTLGMNMVAGRDFNKADLSEMDTANNRANFKYSFIVNESAAQELGWSPEEAIGKTIQKGEPGIIKGVVKDFHFSSLHESIGPLVIFLAPDMVQQLFVKVDNRNLASLLSNMEKIWKQRLPHRPFEYRFLDEDYNSLYKTEQRTGQIFSVFALQAILLACLGLFALSAFVTVQRTREIGIRKVLGATVGQIVILLSKEFLILVGIGVIIAFPLALVAGKSWLNDFAYRIPINAWMFVWAAAIAIIIAFLSVSFQSLKAANSNPVKSLKVQ